MRVALKEENDTASRAKDKDNAFHSEVNQEVNADLALNNSRQLDSLFGECPHCERKIVAQLLQVLLTVS